MSIFIPYVRCKAYPTIVNDKDYLYGISNLFGSYLGFYLPVHAPIQDIKNK